MRARRGGGVCGAWSSGRSQGSPPRLFRLALYRVIRIPAFSQRHRDEFAINALWTGDVWRVEL
eukprot:2774964-Rhodomonas_salina.1